MKERTNQNGDHHTFHNLNLKPNRLRFISDFRNPNKQSNHKPCQMPNINKLLLRLEGFQYATSLDLNIGYYRIQLRKMQVTHVGLFSLR